MFNVGHLGKEKSEMFNMFTSRNRKWKETITFNKKIILYINWIYYYNSIIMDYSSWLTCSLYWWNISYRQKKCPGSHQHFILQLNYVLNIFTYGESVIKSYNISLIICVICVGTYLSSCLIHIYLLRSGKTWTLRQIQVTIVSLVVLSNPSVLS